MAYRKPKAYREGISSYDFRDDGKHILTEWTFGIPAFCETADYQARQSGQPTGPIQLIQHPVDIIQELPDIFDEQDLPSQVDLRGGSHQMREQRKITAE